VGHVEIEIRVGRFEAFALIETQVVSSVQESVAGRVGVAQRPVRRLGDEWWT
jgi:hypothetical protein